MEPTLHDGDRLLVRYAATPRPGRIAVVRLPPDDDGATRPVAVKRLSHLEGGAWWVERDNPQDGVDSWQVGALPASDVLALVVARIRPRPSLLRTAPRRDRPDAGPGSRR